LLFTILSEKDLNLLVDILIEHRRIQFTNVIALIVDSGVLLKLSNSTIIGLTDLMKTWLLKHSNLSRKQLHDLKKEAGFNTLLFLFVITILIIGGRFVNKLLPLLNRFEVNGVKGPNRVPRTEVTNKINKIIRIFHSYGYQGLTKYHQPRTIFKARTILQYSLLGGLLLTPTLFYYLLY